MSRPRMLIVKTGTAVESVRRRFGDFESWFQCSLGRERFDYETCAVFEGDRLPAHTGLDEFAGVVVTGSPAMVSHRHEWSERTARWLAGVAGSDTPLLGVCYGHQLIAHALGGRVAANPHGRRMGTCDFIGTGGDHPLLPSPDQEAAVQATHVEVVVGCPENTTVIGRAEQDPHHALDFGHRSWGVQFHPEFDVDIMAGYVEARRVELEREGFDPDDILAAIRPSPAGERLMERFARICLQHHEAAHGVGA